MASGSDRLLDPACSVLLSPAYRHRCALGGADEEDDRTAIQARSGRERGEPEACASHQEDGSLWRDFGAALAAARLGLVPVSAAAPHRCRKDQEGDRAEETDQLPQRTSRRDHGVRTKREQGERENPGVADPLR